MSVTFYTTSTETDLNVANGNFVRIMELIGMPVDSCGDFYGKLTGAELDDMHARVTFALDSLRAMPELDGGTTPTEYRAEGGALVIECGRPDGYFRDRLVTLLDIINAAREGGQPLIYS